MTNSPVRLKAPWIIAIVSTTLNVLAVPWSIFVSIGIDISSYYKCDEYSVAKNCATEDNLATIAVIVAVLGTVFAVLVLVLTLTALSRVRFWGMFISIVSFLPIGLMLAFQVWAFYSVN